MVGQEVLDDLLDEVSAALKRELGDSLESLMLFGSYCVGKYSPNRPDLNFFIAFKDRAKPEDLIAFGKLLNRIAKKFEAKCALRIEFRPLRPMYHKRKGDDVYIAFSLAEMANKDLKPPFGMPLLFLDAVKSNHKVIFGSDVLEGIKIKLSRHDILAGMFMDFALFCEPLKRAPVQFDLPVESDRLFNEAFVVGKFAAYCGVEIMMSEEQLNKREHLKYIEDKGLMPEFFRKNYSEEVAKHVEFILNCRSNYALFKDDPRKAEELFEAALKLAEIVQQKLFSLTS